MLSEHPNVPSKMQHICYGKKKKKKLAKSSTTVTKGYFPGV